MNYDIEALQAALAKVGPEVPKPQEGHSAYRTIDALVRQHEWLAARDKAHDLLLNAARAGLLEHAAIGRALIEHVKKDGGE